MTFDSLINFLPMTNREKISDCQICCSKIHSDGQSWFSLSTGMKATYWLIFCAVSAVCVFFPNESEHGIIDDQWMNLHGRAQTNDLFRIFDPNAYAQRYRI